MKHSIIEKVILDFDGTLTNPWEEMVLPAGNSFIVNNLRNFRTELGIAEKPFMDVYKQIEAEIKEDPTQGWIFGDHDTVPAIADPYLLNNVVQKVLFDRLKSGSLNDVLGSEGYNGDTVQTINVDDFMYGNFMKSYRDDVIVYRENKAQAQQFMDSLQSFGLDVVVVTNSKADKVKNKLNTLDRTEDIDVVGEAKKMFVNPEYDALPYSTKPEGFSREVLLRREHYHKALLALESERGFFPDNTIVIGDIYEFDHAVPLILGYRSILLGSDKFTPGYEKIFLNQHQYGAFVTTFKDAISTMRTLAGK